MAYHLFGIKQLPKPALTYCDLGNKFRYKVSQNAFFFQENTFEMPSAQSTGKFIRA